ncbi:MAG TPA: methyltransferase [Terracidiphilus sp.]|nr:methyltransferase [Terracidiphilus sp.]
MDAVVTTSNPQASALPSRARLLAIVLIRAVVFSGILCALLFIPAGTWHFWQAWAFAAFYVLPVIGLMLWLAVADPRTLQRRLKGREREPKQRKVILTLIPLLLLALTSPGFDYRFGWTRTLFGPVPAWLSLCADFLILAGVLFIAWTIAVNRFAARTIRVEEGQQVISSGPYRAIRHPMYTGFILTQLAMPIGMASLVTLPLFLLLIVVYVIRLLDEEKVLARDLPGYSEYCQRTRWRLIPCVW